MEIRDIVADTSFVSTLPSLRTETKTDLFGLVYGVDATAVVFTRLFMQKSAQKVCEDGAAVHFQPHGGLERANYIVRGNFVCFSANAPP